jgi:hypothetical protein
MDKKALSEYALFARRELENQIRLSLNRLGIFSDSIKTANIVGDFTIVEGTQETFPKRVYGLRNSIIENHIKERGFDNVVEEFAYTWFNRIIAIRFLEVHDYFSHGFRVLTSRDGSYEPEILANLPYVKDSLHLDSSVIESLKTQNKTEELYRYVLFKQCNALNLTLPMLFDEQESYLELLLPTNLLSEGSVIRKINDIPEEDFRNDVEVIGWLYQFYVASNREKFRKSKKVGKDLLPTLSEVFTPDWLVRYMVQNSLGRIWVESYPNSSLKKAMTFFVDGSADKSKINDAINEAKKADVDPLLIKVIEPCCGSGHILVYAFDLLFQMYLEKGYSAKDIPALILKNNLYGLDVDKRAAQLSQFALMMKARSIDNRFLSSERIVFPKVFEIEDSTSLIDLDYKKMIVDFGFSEEAQETIIYLVDTFRYGRVVGSLLKVEKRNYQKVIDEITEIRKNYIPNILETTFYSVGLRTILLLCNDAILLSSKYDVMVTNPPYLDGSKLEDAEKEYCLAHYKDGKDDLSVMFMETDFVKPNGYISMVNPDSWMFLPSFAKMRNWLFSSKTILSGVHLGLGAFDATVQTVSFTLKNSRGNCASVFYRLVSSKNKEEAFFDRKNVYVFNVDSLACIPQKPIAYWVSQNTINCFSTGSFLGSFVRSSVGIQPVNPDRYVHFWWEVNERDINFSAFNVSDTFGAKKWFPYNKGGLFRKWYGNDEMVIDWQNDGAHIKTEAQQSGHHYQQYADDLKFKPLVTWSRISSGPAAFRLKEPGYLSDMAGFSLYAPREELLPVLGFCNSLVARHFLSFLAPTLNFMVGQVAAMPFDRIFFSEPQISNLVAECIELEKKDWDSRETSWNYRKNPLCNGQNLAISFQEHKKQTSDDFKRIQELETNINRFFIDHFGLEKEIDPNVSEKEIGISVANEADDVRSLISYLIGVLFGRYSFSKEGIVYGGPSLTDVNQKGDDSGDGIVPLYRFSGISDSLSSQICRLLRECFGEADYADNLRFIARALGEKNDESPEECLDRYLIDDFYEDHLKQYQKRPIYWMLSSGKHQAFQCLIYMQKFNQDTLARVNSKYFLKRTEMYKTEETRLVGKMSSSELSAQEKKTVENQLAEIRACEEELLEYGQILDHLASQNVSIDLDKGVKENYSKFQSQKLIVDGAILTKDLLVPVKGLEAEPNEY